MMLDTVPWCGGCGDRGECEVAAHVRELREAFAKLAATVMWWKGGPAVAGAWGIFGVCCL